MKLTASRVRAVQGISAALLAVIGVFFAIRLATDWPHILSGTPTGNPFAERYINHPWIAYLHITAGVAFVLGAPLQLSRRFRTRHWSTHRRLGRALVACAFISGVFALIFGTRFAWGGPIESAATVVFGTWFLVCVVMGFASIRRRRVAAHRRWMIRAFAVGLGVGTIRLWVGLFIAARLVASSGQADTLPQPVPFGVAFWLGLTMHVAFAEWWLRRSGQGASGRRTHPSVAQDPTGA